MTVLESVWYMALLLLWLALVFLLYKHMESYVEERRLVRRLYNNPGELEKFKQYASELLQFDEDSVKPKLRRKLTNRWVEVDAILTRVKDMGHKAETAEREAQALIDKNPLEG